MADEAHDRASESLKVVIGMPTFRRPTGLSRAVPALLEQARSLNGAVARVVVVDNDPDGSAAAHIAPWLAPDLTYVHEPRPGIAAARNCALDAARGADALICFDDDEAPRPGWLQEIVDRWREWGCAAVTGPVESVFEGDVDEWVLASGLFSTWVRPTGSEVPGADSGNLLLDLAVLQRHGIRFDEDFGLSGGSDTMLAHTLRHHGEVIRWTQEALVEEHIPAIRSRRSWVVTRTVRTSNTWSRMRLALAERTGDVTRTRVELVARGLWSMARGLVARSLALALRQEAMDARGAIQVARGRGLVLGAVGIVSYGYARPASAEKSS